MISVTAVIGRLSVPVAMARFWSGEWPQSRNWSWLMGRFQHMTGHSKSPFYRPVAHTVIIMFSVNVENPHYGVTWVAGWICLFLFLASKSTLADVKLGSVKGSSLSSSVHSKNTFCGTHHIQFVASQVGFPQGNSLGGILKGRGDGMGHRAVLATLGGYVTCCALHLPRKEITHDTYNIYWSLLSRWELRCSCKQLNHNVSYNDRF